LSLDTHSIEGVGVTTMEVSSQEILHIPQKESYFRGKIILDTLLLVNTFAVQFAPNVLLTSRQCANCTIAKRDLISTVLISQIYDATQPLVPTARVNMEPGHISFAKQVNDCAVYEKAGSAGLSPLFDPVRGHGDEDDIPVHTGRKNHHANYHARRAKTCCKVPGKAYWPRTSALYPVSLPTTSFCPPPHCLVKNV
jgi:hypothetical protein